MIGVKKIIRPVSKEFRKGNCGFNHTIPEDLVKSQWQNCTKNVIYWGYRVFLGLFFFGVVIYTITDAYFNGTSQHYMIYLTNWGILLCMVTNVLGAILVTLWHYHPEYADKVTDAESMPKSFKIYWGLHITTLVLSLTISIVYWAILYNDTVSVTITNILTHVFNSICMFIDLLIVAYPIRLPHVFLPIGGGTIYAIFSAIYYACGGLDPHGYPYIYTVLDWSNSGKAIITVILVLLLATILYMIVFMIYKLRVFVYKKFSNDASLTLPIATKTGTNSRKGCTTPTMVTHPASGISILGHDNQAFNVSLEKIP